MHVDPRSPARARWPTCIPLRPGTDIAFLGGVINYILAGDRQFTEYVRHYTNARVIISDAFRDTEELGGFFSGWMPRTAYTTVDSWGYAGTEKRTHRRQEGADRRCLGRRRARRARDEARGRRAARARTPRSSTRTASSRS